MAEGGSGAETANGSGELPENLSLSYLLGGEPTLAWKPVERATRLFTNAPSLGDAGFIKTGGAVVHDVGFDRRGAGLGGV